MLARVAEGFEPRIPGLADRITTRVRTEVDELRTLNTAELWEAHRRVTIGSRRAQHRHLLAGRRLPEVCPDPDAEAVRLATYGGLSLSGVLHAFRIGHDVSLEAWLDSVDALDLTTEDREACTRAIVRFTLEYNDRLVRLLEAEYEAERKRVQGQADQYRLRTMRDVIEGVTDRADGLEYDLKLEHVGLIAWGSATEEAVRQIARSLDVRVVHAMTPDGLCWAWLGTQSFENGRREALRELEVPEGTALAIGQPYRGAEGFGQTHRQAGAAQAVASRKPRPVTLYEDVALEALALQDASAAREFVSDSLSGLNGDDKRSKLLRETLEVYFRCEQNAAATAAALRVHGGTIGRRLAEVERLTGRRVNQRRAELETALRVRSLLRCPDY
jgi:hypothetical protein